MFMNDNLGDYFYPLGNNSVVLERPKEWVTHCKEDTAVVHPDMVRLIGQLRLKRPTWRFKSSERVHNDVGQKLTHFNIYDADEELGCIWLETHWRTDKVRYWCANHRIKQAQQRRAAKFSTNVKVAAKNVLDAFSTKSIDERAIDAMKVITNALASTSSTAGYNYGTAERKVQVALKDYIINNWETLRDHAGSVGQIDLVGMHQKKEEATAAYKAFDTGRGVNIATHGDQFLMWRKDKEAQLVGFDSLNDKQRSQLGILKLVEDMSVVDGVGFRVDKDRFFLPD